MPGLTRFVVLLGLVLVGAPGLASAQPVAVPDTWGGDLWSRPRLTGSWGGVRNELGKKGVVLDVDMFLTPQGVMSGGRDHEGDFWGNTEYTLNVDTDKLGLWPGGFFKFMGGSSFGESVYSDSGTMPVNTLPLVPEPNDPSSGLMNASFMQFLSPKFGLVAGKLYTLDADVGEFAGDYRTQFMNSALNLPMSMALVPISAYGGGVIGLPCEGVVLSALVLDPSGTVANNDVSDAFEDGVTVLANAVVDVKPFGRRGHQKVAFMWSDKNRLSLEQDPSNLSRMLLTERFPKLGDPGPILQRILERFFPGLLVPVEPVADRDSTWAMFYAFDQYLWHPDGDEERGIGLFFTFGAADANVNPIKYSYMMGIGGNGVVPGRPHDNFGIGWAHTEFSGQLVTFLRERLPLGLDHEDAFEIYYSAAITPWLNATLDLQVVDPALTSKLVSSGLKDVDTTVVGGLRLSVRF